MGAPVKSISVSRQRRGQGSFVLFALDQPFADAHCSVDADRRGGNPENGPAHLVGIGNNPDAGDFHHRQSLVEGGHGIPEFGLSAADAAVADAYRPHLDTVEAGYRAVGEGLRPLAADLVEAVAEPVELVAELFNKTALVEMGTALAVVMNPAAIGKERPVEAVKLRQPVKTDVPYKKLRNFPV